MTNHAALIASARDDARILRQDYHGWGADTLDALADALEAQDARLVAADARETAARTIIERLSDPRNFVDACGEACVFCRQVAKYADGTFEVEHKLTCVVALAQAWKDEQS